MPASRRRFLASSAAAGSLLITGTRTSRAVAGANDRVRIAVLGCNGRGNAHLDGFGGIPGVEIAAVCDPDQKVLDRTLATLAKKAGDQPLATKGEQDFRRLLDDKTIDAISIAAPNHWHSLMTILAAQAGQHGHHGRDVGVGGVALEDPDLGRLGRLGRFAHRCRIVRLARSAHRGIFPCFLGGVWTSLRSSSRSEVAM